MGLDRDQFRTVHMRLRRPLLAFFRSRKSPSEPEDLVQEVFARLVRTHESTAIANVDSYAFRMAANLARDDHRRERVWRGAGRVAIDVAGDHAADPALIEARDPERILIARDAAARLTDALDALPERTRDIFLLYRLERMRQRDIAEQLGISLSSVEKHLGKAIARLSRLSDLP